MSLLLAGEIGRLDAAANVASSDQLVVLNANNELVRATKAQIGGAGTQTIVDKETPAGVQNGINTTFTLSNTPTPGTDYVFLNGVLAKAVGVDYTLVGSSVIFTIPPLPIDIIQISYRY